MMHSLCFRFPPILDKFSDSVENFQNVAFSRKEFRFSSAKISDDLFLSHRPQISKFPPFFPVLVVHFPPVSRKLLFPPTLKNVPPLFEKFICFLHTLCVFRFPPTLTMMHLCITQCTDAPAKNVWFSYVLVFEG